MAVSPSVGTQSNKGRQFRLPLLRTHNCHDDSTTSLAAGEASRREQKGPNSMFVIKLILYLASTRTEIPAYRIFLELHVGSPSLKRGTVTLRVTPYNGLIARRKVPPEFQARLQVRDFTS